MPAEPIILPPSSVRPDTTRGVEAKFSTLVIGEWTDANVGEVAPLHVHHADDEAWHVISGTLRFRFADREVLAEAGSTVFVPASVPHTWGNAGPGSVHYLIVTTARLSELISQLHQVDRPEHAEVFHKYESELLE